MEEEDKVRSILEKLKSEYKTESQNILIARLEESLELIGNAKKQMRQDAEDKNIPYGFDKDRFGQMRQHSGVDIIKTQHYSIRGSLKQLENSVDASKPEEKQSKLAQMKRA